MTYSPRVAVVIPTLNEAEHISDLLDQVLREDSAVVRQVLVADGGSQDETQELVRRAAERDARVRLLDNPRRLQAAGCNLAAAAASAECDALVRLDAHAGYPAGFVTEVAQTLASTQADSVVVRLQTRGRTCFQRAVAAASNSRIGTGGSAHRVGGVSGWTDHGHHAAFRRSRFQALGGYDETFPANEDAEFDARLRRAGGRIWFAGELEVTYWPRRTLWALIRQYSRYGRGRARNLRKTGDRLRLRQLAAPSILVICLGSLLIALWWPPALLAPVAYLAATLAAGLVVGARAGGGCALASGGCAIAMHLSWGAGFYWGLFEPRRGSARPRSTPVSQATSEERKRWRRS